MVYQVLVKHFSNVNNFDVILIVFFNYFVRNNFFRQPCSNTDCFSDEHNKKATLNLGGFSNSTT
jgi:hypothetical protein